MTPAMALVTGGSRGVGAATVLALAEAGYDVAFTYRNKTRRAETVAAQAGVHGLRVLPLRCDITRSEDLDLLFAQLAEGREVLDLLVLNASGGLEADLVAADPQYPMRINRDAQLELVDRALPLMRWPAAAVFVTSHWAHLFGRVEQLPAYAPVAASKHAGEHALRARQTELAQRGVRLIVVTGDLIEGTITARLLKRTAANLIGERRRGLAVLPTPRQMAEAIVRAATDPSLPSGHTIVVGGELASV